VGKNQLGEEEQMSEEVKLNDGVAAPPEKSVFNPKQEILNSDLIAQKVIKFGEKLLYFFQVGMKRYLIIKKPDGKELFRIPFTLFIILIVLTQFLLLPVAAVLVVFFKWKIVLEEKVPPTAPPSPSTGSGSTTSSSTTLPSDPPTNSSGYSEPTLPPMPT
jgi:hypothetical protein